MITIYTYHVYTSNCSCGQCHDNDNKIYATTSEEVARRHDKDYETHEIEVEPTLIHSYTS